MSSGGGSTRWWIWTVQAVGGILDACSAAGIEHFYQEHDKTLLAGSIAVLAIAIVAPIIIVGLQAQKDEARHLAAEARRDSFIEEAAKTGKIFTNATRIDATKCFLKAAAQAFQPSGTKVHLRA